MGMNMKKIYLKRTIQGGLGPATQREESERDVRILTMLVGRVWGGLDVYNDTKKTTNKILMKICTTVKSIESVYEVFGVLTPIATG
ncbi:MAG: hypothetical protein ACK559_36530, partial [bacterium]